RTRHMTSRDPLANSGSETTTLNKETDPMKKLILTLLLAAAPLAMAQDQFTFTTYNPGGYSTTMLNYFPTPMVGHGLRVTVRGCDATVTTVNTMTGGIGLASLDFRASYEAGVTEWG